jgi:serine/threonine-protein kinase
MREAHLYHPVPTAEVPNDLQGLAARGMAKDPGERPPDAAAFIEELEATARHGYGAAWEERGRGELARRVALLALLLPLGAGATTAAGAAAIQITRRASRGARQLWTGAVAAAAVVLAIVAGIVAGKAQSPPTPTANVAAEPTLTIDATLPPTTPPPTSASPSPSPSLTPTPTHTHTVAPPPPPPPPSSSSSSAPPPPPPGPTVTDLTVTADVFICPNIAGTVIYCATAHVHVVTTDGAKFTVTVTFSQKNSKSFTVEEAGTTKYDFDVPSGSVLYAADICTSPRDTMTVTATVPAAQGHDPATTTHICEPGVIG